MSDTPGVAELVTSLRALQVEYQLTAVEAMLMAGPIAITVRLEGLTCPIGEIFDSNGNRFQLPQPIDG